MATAASTADLVIRLVDARGGVLTQTRRHSRLAQQAGISHLVNAVNNMELVACSLAGAYRRKIPGRRSGEHRNPVRFPAALDLNGAIRQGESR